MAFDYQQVWNIDLKYNVFFGDQDRGSLGNLIDRVRFGYVVDFVKMYWESHVWPNYNVADSAISIGLVLLVIDSFRPRDRETAANAPSVPSS